MASRTVTEIPVAANAPAFAERTVTVRGVSYRLRELSSKEYDGIFPKVLTRKDEDGNPAPDTVLLLKLMLKEALVEPKLSGDAIADLPLRVVNSLLQATNELHFGDEPSDEDPKGA